MTPFETLCPNMDAQVRNHLGDSISVELKSGARGTILGFITNNAADLGIEGTDPIRRMWHCKIDITAESLALLPNGPADIRRISHCKLPGPHKPAADSLDGAGASGTAWIFDLQKARPE